VTRQKSVRMRRQLFRLIVLIISSEISCIHVGAQVSSQESVANETDDSIAKSSATNKSGVIRLRGAPTGESSSNDASIYSTLKNSPDTKQDHMNFAFTSNDQHRQYSNHQNHPVENNSIYGSQVGSAQADTTSEPNFQQHQLNMLLNRDHHQSTSIGIQKQFNDNNEIQANTFSNSYGNQAIGRPSDGLITESTNFNYGGTSNSFGLNAGLIQNLTASLFPIRQLSNASLHSLSELLNRTRNHADYPSMAETYKPMHQFGYSNYYNQNQPTASSSPVASTANYLDTPVSDQSYNLFDYMRPNQMGHRDQSPRYHNQLSNLRAKPSINSFNFNGNKNQPNSHQYNAENQYKSAQASIYNDNNSNNGYRTSSNIYNTYMPYKENLSSMPTITNGQTLNMALYGNYADNGYKLPFAASPKVVSSSFGNLALGNGGQGTNANAVGSNNYQYIQHHNVNKQDHLDRVIYHSTPFRPSIVNPPFTQQSTTTSTPGGPSNITPASHPGSLAEPIQRSKTEADNKSIAFASMGSSSSNVKESKPEYTTNGQVINTSRYTQIEQRQTTPSQEGSSRGGVGDKTTTTSSTTSRPTIDDYDVDHPHNSAEFNFTSDGPRNQTGNSSLSTGPAILFDLYEREIDNQIRAALYNEHHNTDPFMGVTRTLQPSWFDKPAPVYEDPPVDQTLTSWSRPLALGTHNAHLPTRIRPPSHISDHNDLAAALQDLPTFSASDLQPIFPTGPTYSLLPAASHDSFSDTALASLASQLFPINFKSPNSDFEHDSKPKANSNNLNQQHQMSSSIQSHGSMLPAFLYKLHSSPLSSILASPLTHLYSNLPRYRDSKKQNTLQPSQQHKTHQSTSSSNSYSHLISPTSLLTYPLLGGRNLLNPFGGSSLNDNTPSLINSGPKAKIHKQKQQQAAMANILAAASMSTQSWNPLQAALLQAQASPNHLAQGAVDSDLSTIFGNQPMGSSPFQAAEQATYDNNGIYRFTGGGISPLVWRTIFSPAHWARKQSLNSGGQTLHPQQQSTNFTSNQSAPAPSSKYNHGSHTQKPNGSQQREPQQQSQQVGTSKLHLPLGSLFGNGGLASHLFGPMSSASSSVQTSTSGNSNSPTTGVAQSQKKPRLKIKILKIPVAVYDQPTLGSSVGQASAVSTLSLLPPQMQPSLTASLLANMPCPLSHSGHQIAHSLEQHLMPQSQAAAAALALGTVLPGHPISPTSPATAQLGSQLPLTAGAPIENPISIQGFTDINQPNDLQVSPSSLQGKLFKML